MEELKRISQSINNKPFLISIKQLRNLAIIKQGLHTRPKGDQKIAVLNTIKKLGLIQMDSVNVVTRSHYIVLFSRLGKYPAKIVDELQYPEGKISEQWIHVASVINNEELTNLIPEFNSRRKKPLSNRQYKILGENYKEILAETVQKVKVLGIVSTSDFKEDNPNKNNWWSKKPARVALDILFRRGYLAISFRNNFKCFYSIQNKITKSDKVVKLIDYHKWATLKSIEAMGAATIEHISDYYRIEKKHIIKAVDYLLCEGKIIPVIVDGNNDSFYSTKNNLNIIKKGNEDNIIKLTTFLSPFDNLIWNRDRTELLFNFKYRSEMYTPSSKRQYGYYVLPILHDGNFVGRMDPKLDRKTGTLIINNIDFEDGVKLTDYLLTSISKALIEFAQFLDVHKVCIIKCSSQLAYRYIKNYIHKFGISP